MNNLSDREKILAYAVLSLLPLFVLYFGFSYFMSEYSARKAKLNSARQTLADMKFRADEAAIKTLVRNDFRQRSLHADKNVAQSEYRQWLQQLVEEDIKFSEPKVAPKATIPFKSDFGDKPMLFNQLSFQLTGVADYQQIVDFMYRFYEKNYLHRIERVDLNLLKAKAEEGKIVYNRKKFSVKFQIQAVSLVDADDQRNSTTVHNAKLFYQPKNSEKLISELEDYYSLILRRNLFGLPNNAPDFGSRKKEFDFVEGDRVTVRLNADDEDNDDLEYVLVSTDNKVASDKIEQSSSGRFSLDIEELGEYRFMAKVVDKNYYSKSDEMEVVVLIEEKEVKEEKKEDPPPKFDPLKFTTLEAIVQNFEGELLCWIYVRPFDKMYKLTAGGEFEIGRAKGSVVSIGRRTAVIEIDGKRFEYEVNDFLGSPTGDEIVVEKTGGDMDKGIDVTTEKSGDDEADKSGDSDSARPEPPGPEIDLEAGEAESASAAPVGDPKP